MCARPSGSVMTSAHVARPTRHVLATRAHRTGPGPGRSALRESFLRFRGLGHVERNCRAFRITELKSLSSQGISFSSCTIGSLSLRRSYSASISSTWNSRYAVRLALGSALPSFHNFTVSTALIASVAPGVTNSANTGASHSAVILSPSRRKRPSLSVRRR